MIHRRMFLGRSLGAAALCGASTAAQAQMGDGTYDLATDRFCQTLTAALSETQYQDAYARAVQAGWVDQAAPKLSALKAQIADDHGKGASQRIKGIRFSDTEIA